MNNESNRKKRIDFDLDETSMAIFNNRIEILREDCESYAEAVAAYCESIDCEIEDVLPLISNGLKEKMYNEGIERRTIIDDEPNLFLGDD